MKYKLKEIFDLQMGKTPARNNDKYWNTKDYKWISIADLTSTDKYINNTKEYISRSAVKESGIKIIPANTVVMSFKLSIGKTAILSEDMYSNEAIMAFHDKHVVELLPEYTYYLIKAKNWNGGSNRAVMGQTLNKATLSEIEVDVHTIDEQRKIVELLNLLGKIIYKRNTQLSKLRDILSARFVEMFGDPQINHFGWDVINISEVINGKVSNGFFAKRDDYVDDGNVSILGVSNIVNRMYSKIDGLPKTNANDKDIAKFEVKYGDMLFCRSSLVAEGIGKASIIPEDIQENVLFECHVIRLPLDLNKCVPEFMQTLSSMEYFRNQIIAQSKTATMTTIGQDGIIKTEIILPPINKQREYYQFVKEVNKSKLLSVSQPQIHIYKTLTLL